MTEFRALTFDCYGTLIDWETGLWHALQPLLVTGNDPPSRPEVLQAYAEIETMTEAELPGVAYPEVLQQAHHLIAERFSLTTSTDMDLRFGSSVGRWPAFADSAGALIRLKSFFSLVILSNVDRASFALSNRLLAVDFDAVYTAEDIGSYKPNPANFRFLISRLREDLGVEPHQILHTAQSLFHDHVPASAIGLATAWIDRQGLSVGGDWGATLEVKDIPSPDYTFLSLAEMADAVETAHE